MKDTCLAGLKGWFCACLLWVFVGLQAEAGPFSGFGQNADEPPVTVAEMRYEKLMKVYVNKIKQAFAEPEDQRSEEILARFLPEFNMKTEGIKTELQEQLKQLNSRDKEQVMSRLWEKAQTEELIALHFDERVTSRTAKNAKLKTLMDQLHAKSLEVQQTGQQYLAAD